MQAESQQSKCFPWVGNFPHEPLMYCSDKRHPKITFKEQKVKDKFIAKEILDRELIAGLYSPSCVYFKSNCKISPKIKVLIKAEQTCSAA